MNQSPENLNSNELSARVASILSAEREIAYARITPELTITGVSDKFQKLFPFDKKPITGTPVSEILWEFVGAEAILDEILRGQRPKYQIELVNRQDEDGSPRFINFLVFPQAAQQPERGLLIIAEDVTPKGLLEQKLTQDRNELRLAQVELSNANAELQRLNRLQSLFLTIVAHDLRAPLTVILGNAALLRDDLAAANAGNHDDSLVTIITQVEWLDRLVSNILELDQIEQGRLTINPRPIDLKALVQESTTSMAETARLFGLTLNTVLPEDSIPIHGDPDRIRQILFNLLSNAIKYTPTGGRIEVTAWGEKDQAAFQIKDTGVGISEKEMAGLFQLYYRTAEAQKSERGGTGLGLYIVKTFVKAHQGEIDVASQPGKGTTFTVRLPLGQPG